MPTRDRSTNTQFLRGQLDSYEEAWKAAHIEAMELWETEEPLEVGVAMLSLIVPKVHHWKQQVFRGSVAHVDAYEVLLRAIAVWGRDFSELILTDVERRFGERVEDLRHYAALVAVAKDLRTELHAWSSPRLSPAIGLRELDMTEESAAEFDRILARPAKPVPPSGVNTVGADALDSL